MSRIKLKEVNDKYIKKLDKKHIASDKFKSHLVDIKEKNSEESVSEYGSNKVEYISTQASRRGARAFSKLGNKSVLTTKNNFLKVKNKIKTIKSKFANRKSKKLAIKTSKRVVKKTVKAPIRIANNIRRLAKGVKVAITTTFKTIKAIVFGVKAIITALIAGGWIIVVVIVVICVIYSVLNSVFGIFFSSNNTGEKTMSSVISELNNEFAQKIATIQSENVHDDYVLNINRTEWKNVLAVYTVIVSNGKNATNVVTIDDNKTKVLKEVFWKMNVVNYSVQDENDGMGGMKRVLYINVESKSVNDMMVEYNFNTLQKEQIKELLSDKYASLWSNVIHMTGGGDSNVVDIALSQVGNVGGKPYWQWYGFNSRVEWCAVFVSWVFNQAGYLNTAVPKFSTCHTQGVPWFKSMGLWKEKGYIPKAGDVIFFDWEQDGHTDHVGIVEKSDEKNVYTVEGNSRDEVKQKKYSINSKYIYGYGIPNY